MKTPERVKAQIKQLEEEVRALQAKEKALTAHLHSIPTVSDAYYATHQNIQQTQKAWMEKCSMINALAWVLDA